MALSPNLRSFLQLWWDQRDDPSVTKRTIVHPSTGLCGAIPFYVEAFNLSSTEHGDMMQELEGLFISQDLDEVFPFNNKRADDYYLECDQKRAHLNPARRAWVEAMLKA